MAEFDTTDFDAIKISLASADTIRSWSHGEVKKPETINYRTLKPEKDGLFCEKIFGPVKDWECSCGKYKGIRFKGIICERCGVEVTSAKVRRERMGHIELAAPVSHIWYFKSPATFPLSRLLDIKSKDLEKVLYFASYIITDVDTEARDADAADLKEELAADLEELDAERDDQIQRVRAQAAGQEEGSEFDGVEPLSDDEIRAEVADLEAEYAEEKQLRQEAFDQFMQLEKRQLIADEALFSEMKRYYSIYFKGGMGAEAIRELLRGIDLEKEAEELRAIVSNEESQKQKRDKAVKRLEIVDSFLKGGNDPADMILDVIPVIPPDLRPMVQLDGGRFAASDLNDLYRRVINRNNRLKRLLSLDAPDIIVNNEKRMLQEAVDALFDNGRRGRPVTGRGGRALKSLAESLKGKQGRFRQNLLGKRVDYSGRSVIVVDPQLKLHQCGLPKTMALELFRPFVMRRLVELGKVENIKGAKRAIDRSLPAVWDVLDEVIKDRLVLLNRAPTLHRLSIQAFEPVLVEGKAIHLHPLVCAPFNADFDGDQMSVHVPLSTEAQTEARVLMLSANNLRSPASGKVLTVPSQDMVFGVYYLTTEKDGVSGEGAVYADFDDAVNTIENDVDLDMQAKVTVRVYPKDANVIEDGRRLFRVKLSQKEVQDFDVTDGPVHFETTTGRIIFNRQCLPADFPFINYKMVKSDIGKLVNECCDRYSTAEVEPILDAIKATGFHYATRAGLTVSVWDAVIPPEKQSMLDEAQAKVDEINENYEDGFLTEQERHVEVVNAWTECTEALGSKMLSGFSEDNPIYMMADSGARGSKTQLRQLAGMRGLMADMSGDTIDLPIKSNFREGLEPLEYFISTYGARKGLVDTASHTSDSGYLTRRLVDVAQDVIVREEDCGTDEAVHYNIYLPGTTTLNTDLIGRCTLHDVVDPETGEVLMAAGDYIESAADLQKLADHKLKKVELRALLTCKSKYGVCQKCYGWDLSTRRPVNIGTAVGVIAAQSIGEPGTQLTMRTFHSGGVAGDDITQGLPRVEELFEARKPKHHAIIAEIEGDAEVEDTGKGMRKVTIHPSEGQAREYAIPYGARMHVKQGMHLMPGDKLTEGSVNPHDILRVCGLQATQRYLVYEVQKVYKSQGVEINDKHIEVMVRQMLHKVKIEESGTTDFLPGEYIDINAFETANTKAIEEDGEPAVAKPILLGITKASLATDSFLSAASFQETTRVLTDAAIKGKVDPLIGLKENVIIGKLIPAGTGMSRYRNLKVIDNDPKPVEEAPVAAPEESAESAETVETVETEATTENTGA